MTGAGAYLADALPSGCLHAVFVRGDRASARLTRIDADAARAMPGVRAVLLAADLAPLADLPQDSLPRDDGGTAFACPVPLLAHATLRHIGEPLAMVIATTAAQALDAAEAVMVTSEDIGFTSEVAFVKRAGNAEAVQAALAGAAMVVTVPVTVPRLHAAPLEPRGCFAETLPCGRLHLRSSTQNPFALRKALAQLMRRPPDSIRVTAGDVGGSFGLKGFLTREEALVAHAATLLGQPVCWLATRSESFLADHQGRGVTGLVTLGLDGAGRFLALSAAFSADVGAYASNRSLGLVNNLGGLVGVYDIPLSHVTVTGMTSARAPIAPFRGHGRPEATLALEQAVDAAARQLGVSRVALRRRNLVTAAQLPYQTALAFRFDSGDFPALFDRLTALADVKGAPGRAAAATSRGMLHGLGVITCVEAAGGPVRAPRPDHARLTFRADGTILLAPGVMSTGQGHETGLVAMAAAALDVPVAAITYLNGDTDALVDGRGSGGSSGLAVAGAALHLALDRVHDDGLQLAARHLDCPVESITFAGGVFRAEARNATLSLAELAAAQGGEWVVGASFTPPAATFPNGAHACEIEIDPDTGAINITRYTAVEDVGTVLNPALVEGQMQGGIAQGLAQGLGECMEFDAEQQILTGSFMDYRMFRSTDCFPLVLASHPSPTPVNPLGVKGVGEAGTVGALAALKSAVDDALARAGVTEPLQLPATPLAVWQALQHKGNAP
nr:xanthine dehydrogenase family protein molybdopterin-binding subunit [Fertoeibacter niger]